MTSKCQVICGACMVYVTELFVKRYPDSKELQELYRYLMKQGYNDMPLYQYKKILLYVYYIFLGAVPLLLYYRSRVAITLGYAQKNRLYRLIDKVAIVYPSYLSAVVLGLNDALIELSGALVGLSFIFIDTTTIAIIGLITGVSAALSMAASSYLEQDVANAQRSPLLSAWFTGSAYFITVLILILPYLIFADPLKSLVTMLGIAVSIIGLFSYYTALTEESSFVRRFSVMVSLSLGVAAFSFIFSQALKYTFNINL